MRESEWLGHETPEDTPEEIEEYRRLKEQADDFSALARKLSDERDRIMMERGWKEGFNTGMWAVTTGTTGVRNPYEKD